MESIAKVFYGAPVKRMSNAQMTDLEIAGFATGHFGDLPDEGFYVAIRQSVIRSALGMAMPVRPLVIDDAWTPRLAAAVEQHKLEPDGPPGWYLVSYLDT